MRPCARIALFLIAFVVVPAVAFAQASITGVVRDSSGAVLPGVTVEAASPALIEKVRSVVTDGTGQYRIENLRPGSYTVTFSLPGFSSVQREGLQLTGTFTATVNADMRVGGLEETITVAGASPVVDVQSTTRQSVLNRETINMMPAGQNQAILTALVPTVVTSGAGVDLSGSDGEARFSHPGGVAARGVNEPRTVVGGLSLHSAQGSGQTGGGNIAAYEEIIVDTGGISIEQKEGGVRMELVPRQGGNNFSGSAYTALANSAMQGDNLTQALRDRGLPAANSLKQFGDYSASLGGPILRDRVWFFTTGRYNVSKSYVPIFLDKNAGNPNAWTYEPDTSRTAVREPTWKGGNARVTWQADEKNKLSLAYDLQDSCQCPVPTATRTLEASEGARAYLRPKDFVMAGWTAPLTNRLLLEAGMLRHREHAYRPRRNNYLLNVPVPMIPVTEQSVNLQYRGSGIGTDTWNRTALTRFVGSYITGAHALKSGVAYERDRQEQERFGIDSAMTFRFNNGVPNQITLNAMPWLRQARTSQWSLFSQDRWTIRKLTVTGGLRYDYFHSFFPATTVGPGEFVPTRTISFPKTDGVRWHDLSPRVGVAIDVFGNGKTALKASANKYLAFHGLPNDGALFTNDMAPASLLVTSANRAWDDANRNFVPDCNLILPAANGECGQMSNVDFGTTRPGRSYDPATLKGWNLREHNWQFSVGAQQEVLPGMSVEVSYFRTNFGGFIVVDNRAVAPSDFDRFSLVAPRDSRLPGGGGYTVSGFSNLKPSKFGVPADDLITFADNYGDRTERWDGVDFTVNSRPRAGLTFQGGINMQRQMSNTCDILEKLPETNPVGLPFCDVSGAFRTQGKFFGSYTVPRIDVLVAGTFQSLAGPEILSEYVASSAEIAPSLGRPLSGGTRTLTLDLVRPGTLYGPRVNQLDMRVGKLLRHRKTRTSVSLDIFNVLNSSTIIQLSNRYANWQAPQGIMNPRFAKFVVQFDF